MKQLSLTQRLLLVLIGALGITLIAIIAATLVATSQSAERNVARELGVGERVLRSLMEQRGNQLSQAASVLADDFGFRRAIATEDDDTIVSALINHGQRLNADLMVLFSADGEVLTTTHELPELESLQDFMPAEDQAFGFLNAEENFYQLVVAPVRAPHLIASVGMGFAVDQPLAQSLRQLTNADVTFFSDPGTESAGSAVVSTLPDALLASFDSARVGSEHFDTWLEQQQLRGRLVQFEGATRPQPTIMLSASYAEAASVFQPLREQMIWVSLVMLVLATAVGLALGRRIVDPLRALATAAGEVARGYYDRPIPAHGNDEIGRLADSFRHMQYEIAEREDRISYQLLHDTVTGLPNRRSLTQAFERCVEDGGQLTVAIIQVRNFRDLHDTLGQQAVEQVLPQVATRLRDSIPQSGFAAVLAEDKFALLLSGRAKLELAALQDALSQPYRNAGVTYSLKFQLGIAQGKARGEALDDLLRQAHIALTRAETTPAGIAWFEPGEDDRYLRRLAITEQLEPAIRGDVFQLVYQPLVRLGIRELAGAEVLVRWEHETLGFVSPAEFIPMAEQSGQISALTRRVLARAIRQAAQWQAQGKTLPVSVNLSAADLQDPSLFDFLDACLSEHALTPAMLSLEVTESAFIEDAERACKHLDQLRGLGLQVALDDFGSGYASLSQLKGLPVDRLKIDKSFVLDLDTDQADRDIVRSTIDLGHRLGLQVIAEGVETRESLLQLEAWGCDMVQGFYLSRPVDADRLLQWRASGPLPALWAG